MTTPWAWRTRARRLARQLPARTADAALGDLLEEFGARSRRAGRVRAEWWLWLEVRSLTRAYRASARGSDSMRRGGVALGRRGDLTQALRALRRAPWYALTVAGVIALSMALTTTVFAIVDGVLFKPLPYPAVDRLFGVSTAHAKLPDSSRSLGVVSEVDVNAWAEALPSTRFAAFYIGGFLATGTNEGVRSAQVDASFFDVVGIKPSIGGFEPGDFAARSKIEPAVITQGFWLRRFGGDPSVVGRAFIGEGGIGFRVAGILPPDFVFPSSFEVPDAITPLIRSASPSRGSALSVLARLPGAMAEREASARLTVAAAQLASSWPVPPPRSYATERSRILSRHLDVVELEPIRDALTSGFRETSWIVLWATITLLLLACANVTGLAVARVQDRWRELALRRSLGAGYGDLLRLLVVEHALIIGAGTATGVWLARPMLALTVRLMSKTSQFLKTPAIDVRVLAFATVAAIACVALVTLLSVQTAWKASLRTAIIEGGATTRRVRRRGFSIVSVQVALALVMAVGGTLVAGSLLRVWREDPGFDVSHTAVIEAVMPAGTLAAGIEDLMADVRQVPGVVHAGGVNHPVVQLAFNGSVFDSPAGVVEQTIVESMAVTAGYLEAGGLRPATGRLPTDAELASGAPVIVVTDLVARQYWPGLPAVGQTLLNEGRTFAVVGVVPDVRYMALDLDPQGTIYWPMAATPRPFLYNVLVMFTGDGRSSLPGVVARIVERCPKCGVKHAEMLTDRLGASVRRRQFYAWLFSSFGIAALVIVGTGILGLVAMTTNRRTREIGIRLALGATRSGVVHEILREQIAAVTVGLLAGGTVAAWAVRFVTAYLYKTPMYDRWAWAAAIAMLVLVALLGGVIPSLRASRIDPVRALRVE